MIRFLLDPITFFWSAVLLVLLSGRHQRLGKDIRDPGGFLLGATIGVFAYYGTVALLFRKTEGPGEYLQEVGRSLVENGPAAHRVAILGGRAIYEETLWRRTVQSLLGSGAGSVFLTALLFTLRHRYLHYKNRQPFPPLPLLEFFAFSLFLGSLYRLSGRFMVVVAVHFVRNLLIAAECSFPRG
jgi:membrane protease YdiL (CAAX protease family)